jgi:predicted nuclease of predicted toxin-antitoxin system
MNLYLDDDSVDTLLIRLLVREGHDVLLPADVGLAGHDDPEHFAEAIRLDRVLLTGNHRDFEQLHFLILVATGHHPGVLTVRKDNDKTRDMQPPDIVRAIRNLIAAGVPIADELHVLNHWR